MVRNEAADGRLSDHRWAWEPALRNSGPEWKVMVSTLPWNEEKYLHPKKSIPRCRRINRMLSNESLHPPAFSRSNSQASVDSAAMGDFWREIESIRDKGELEAEWLQDVGLSTLISGEEEEDGKALLSTLTRTQAAAVKKRYNTYTQTLRKKSKQPIRDVRDVFGVGEAPPDASCDNHTTQVDGPQEEKQLPEVIKTSDPVPQGASPDSPALCNGSREQEGSFADPGSSPASILEAIPDVPVHTNGSAEPSQEVPGTLSDDDYLEKNIPAEAEELSFEVSYSELVTEAPKRNKWKKSEIKKEDYALTKFIVQKTRFGLTEAGDLSAEDMKKIRHLSLIELTAFFDAFGIQLKRNKTEKVKGRDNGIFGIPLTVLLDNDHKKDPAVKVPLVLQKFFEKVEESGLESEGIFRLSGCTAKVKQYREELDTKFNADKFKWDKMCHREAAVMLKAFFRELPTSLFPVEYIPAFVALMERGSLIRVQLQALHLMVMALPDANRDTAQALMTFFNKVIANESKNRMSVWNISTVMAPNLFFSRAKHSDCEELLLANTAAHILRLMLKYQKILWKVPSFLITQVRRMNEATMLLKKQLPSVKKLLRRKTMEREVPSFLITQVRRMNEATMLLKKQLPSVKKLLRRKTMEREVSSPKASKVLQKSPSARRMSDVPEGVIRVHAPLFSKVSMAIQLTSHTTAKDILAKFQFENSRGSSECIQIQNQRLYEIGGNIGQHCLDPDAYVLDVYRVNPHAEWVIKPQPSP
ncbi:Rho GTPase-activating protein 28 [Fukomys damarensis]|uniref:Rho GTPase-activating protein 28 n=1 Tax=Fukomys damarensis TaxID=885580 RepID=A0A091D9Z4_FUKDA|nr:Rho GTPase-activating protein 28 [Fukomys damarensis]